MFKQGKQFERNQRRYKRLVNNDKLNLISTKQLNIVQKLKSNKYAPLREGYTDMKNMEKMMKPALEKFMKDAGFVKKEELEPLKRRIEELENQISKLSS